MASLWNNATFRFVTAFTLSAAAICVFTQQRNPLSVVETSTEFHPDEPPPIVVTQVHDFGIAEAGTSNRCEFEVTNDMATELRLELIGATHKLSVDSGFSVPSRSTDSITVEYYCPEYLRGQYRQEVDLSSNHPDYDVLQLVVVGTVR